MVNELKIGITGLPGAGKTMTLVRVIDELRESGYTIGGMINEPVMDNRHRVGFTVRDIMTGESAVFAHNEIGGRVSVGKMGIDISVLEDVGVRAIKRACIECDIIVIDEVGKMEVESPAFVDAVKEALDMGKPMILTLHKKSRNPLLQDIRRRDDVRILEVTPTNRSLLPFKIVSLMSGENLK
ncbi:MAG: NTPase [Candidatus Methanomethylophilaceae archaeon]|jgi:nucleoside-triphosphatase|nr:NTPase [Candidatus Methanomethylophilaceae archaeon]MDD2779799.1 NTPase [Candidatus Methanomethylophilaceae archaeon]MDD3127749.1 NTPase [Candidatus Methanomethylophilaceae archaeon]MDD4119245.1 NTPase [Candidatus Methanomethylophilaceae archaeon]MDD4453970.1 NTPase [Candidatus Methanomethylophilaceae archaeon]